MEMLHAYKITNGAARQFEVFFDGEAWQFQFVGDLFIGKPIIMVKAVHFFLPWRQLWYGRVEHLIILVLFEAMGSILNLAGNKMVGPDHRLPFSVRGCFFKMIENNITGDDEDIIGERIDFGECLPVIPNFDKNGLNDILRGGNVFEIDHGCIEYGGAEPAIKFSEGQLITGSNA